MSTFRSVGIIGNRRRDIRAATRLLTTIIRPERTRTKYAKLRGDDGNYRRITRYRKYGVRDYGRTFPGLPAIYGTTNEHANVFYAPTPRWDVSLFRSERYADAEIFKADHELFLNRVDRPAHRKSTAL